MKDKLKNQDEMIKSFETTKKKFSDMKTDLDNEIERYRRELEIKTNELMSSQLFPENV